MSSATTLARKALLMRGDSFKPQAIEWVWPGYMARGKMTLLGGKPGSGKTTIGLALAATITAGGRWPDGTKADAADVIIWSGEDDASDTLIPRLTAMGADLSRIHIVGPVTAPKAGGKFEVKQFDPATDVEALALAMNSITDAAMIITDPIVSAVTGDSHKNSETRRGLQPLVNLAMTQRCALLGITHFSKGTAGRDPVDRITGSLAFGAVARVVLVAAQEQDGEQAGRRLLMRAKSNIGPDTGGFHYELRQDELRGHPGVIASSVVWGGTVEGTAREILAEAEQASEEPGNDTAAFLRLLLADGPKPAKEVFKDGDGAGYSRDQLKRALHRIGGQSRKTGMSGGWIWDLREGSAKAAHRTPAPFTPFTPLVTPFEEKEGGERREESTPHGVRPSPRSSQPIDFDEIDSAFSGRQA